MNSTQIFQPMFWASLTGLLLLVSCGGETESVTAPKKATAVESVKPELPLDRFVLDGCLNLQALSQYVARPEFDFPGRVATYDYSSDRFEEALLIRNFGYREMRLKTLPFLRNVTQANCTELSAETAYGKTQNYKITYFSPTELGLERIDDPENSESVEEAFREAYDLETSLKVVHFTLLSPLQMKVLVEADAQRFGCDRKNTFGYKKTSMYRWAADREQLPQTEALSQVNFNKILKVLPDANRDPIVVANSEENASIVGAARPEAVMPSEGELALSLTEMRRISSLLPLERLDVKCN